MSDPPGLPAALGIEAVECIPEGATLTVRVTGRWRRRRPEWRGPAILVVEAQGTRFRFPAMPEPPSLAGTMPGTWRMSFSVASELAPHLAGRAWLQLGSVVAPLPVFAESMISAPGEESAATQATPGSGEGLGGLPPRSSELAAESARRRSDLAEAMAADLAARADQLERAFEDARTESARLQRDRRAAEQRAHAEAAMRMELEEQLAGQGRALQDARDRSATLEQRVHELERELRRMRRAADEAAHLAASERAARIRAERRAQELEDRPAPRPAHATPSGMIAERFLPVRAVALRAERELAQRALDRTEPAGAAPAPPAALAAREARAHRAELQMRASNAALHPGAGLLQAPAARERARRVDAEHRAAALERALADRGDRWARAYAEIDELRDEIGRIRRVFASLAAAAAATPGAATPAPPATAATPTAAIPTAATPTAATPTAATPIAATPSAAATPTPTTNPAAGTAAPATAAPRDPAGPVRADRLSEALARLREETEPQTQAEAPPPPGPRAREAGVPPPVPTQVLTPATRTTAVPWPPPPARIAEPTAPRAPAPATAHARPTETAHHARPTETAHVHPAGRAAAAPQRKPWLWPVFRSLAAADPLTAGRLILALLPAWRAVGALPAAFDLILGEQTCVRVTVGSGAPEVRYADSARRPGEVHFQVTGDLARLARTLAAGPVRRRLGRGMAGVRGDRAAFASLRLLVRSPLTLGELHGVGVRLDPGLALGLLARMVEPGWTAGQRFVVAHQVIGARSATAYLEVRDGRPVSVMDRPPRDPVDTTIVCAADTLLSALRGEPAAEVFVRGPQWPLALLSAWLDRAQSA